MDSILTVVLRYTALLYRVQVRKLHHHSQLRRSIYSYSGKKNTTTKYSSGFVRGDGSEGTSLYVVRSGSLLKDCLRHIGNRLDNSAKPTQSNHEIAPPVAQSTVIFKSPSDTRHSTNPFKPNTTMKFQTSILSALALDPHAALIHRTRITLSDLM